ncbi:MAG: SDR family oxidoreductase [Ruminiclostridium sp.]|nr:SDR family oxidoreductase [Ruminiclostridium sp.]
MRTIVSGGCGFIGSHLVDRLLDDGHSVTVIDDLSTGRLENLISQKGNPGLHIVEADCNDYDLIRPLLEGVDWVFHLAALADIVPSVQMPEKYFKANVDGMFSVLRASREANAGKFLYAASSSCYGIPDFYPTREDAEIRPMYPYALTKNIGEQVAMHWAKVYKLPVISLRLFNIYGPRSRTSGAYGAVFGVFLAQKLAGKPFTVVGDGTQTRDFTYVTDVADAFITAAKSDIKAEIFNVGSGNTYSINLLTELLGGSVIHLPKRPGEPDCTHADTARIEKMLNWHAGVPFEQGVKKMLENIGYWRKAPVWTPESISDATADWFKYLE